MNLDNFRNPRQGPPIRSRLWFILVFIMVVGWAAHTLATYAGATAGEALNSVLIAQVFSWLLWDRKYG